MRGERCSLPSGSRVRQYSVRTVAHLYASQAVGGQIYKAALRIHNRVGPHGRVGVDLEFALQDDLVLGVAVRCGRDGGRLGVVDAAEIGVLGTQHVSRRGTTGLYNPAVRAVLVLDRRVVVADLVDTDIALRRQQPSHAVAVLSVTIAERSISGFSGAVGVAELAIAVGTSLVRLSAVPEHVAPLIVNLPEVARSAPRRALRAGLSAGTGFPPGGCSPGGRRARGEPTWRPGSWE